MLLLKSDKKSMVAIAMVLFLITAWVLGSMFHTLPHVSQEGTLPGYSGEISDNTENGTAFLSLHIPQEIIRYTVFAALFLLLCASVFKMLTQAKMRREVAAEVIVLSGFLIFFLWWRRILDTLEYSSGSPSSGFTGGFDPSTQATQGLVSSSFFFPLLAITLLILFLLARHVLSLLKKDQETDLEREVSETIDRTLADLYSGADSRSAIIRCYIEISQYVEEKGVSERESFTPREFRVRVADVFDITQEPLVVLTELFEKARYSPHPLSDEERDMAIGSMEDIKAQMGVRG